MNYKVIKIYKIIKKIKTIKITFKKCLPNLNLRNSKSVSWKRFDSRINDIVPEGDVDLSWGSSCDTVPRRHNVPSTHQRTPTPENESHPFQNFINRFLLFNFQSGLSLFLMTVFTFFPFFFFCYTTLNGSASLNAQEIQILVDYHPVKVSNMINFPLSRFYAEESDFFSIFRDHF